MKRKAMSLPEPQALTMYEIRQVAEQFKGDLQRKANRFVYDGMTLTAPWPRSKRWSTLTSLSMICNSGQARNSIASSGRPERGLFTFPSLSPRSLANREARELLSADKIQRIGAGGVQEPYRYFLKG